jgi:GT2 family glycosyltransferase
VELSLVIVNYNLSREIDECVRSILENVESINFEVIIVDNGSTDKHLKVLLDKYSRHSNIRFCLQGNNSGFGAACNIGAAESRGRVVCFLNPDTHVTKGVFKKLLDELSTDAGIGVIGPQTCERNRWLDFSAGFQPNLFFELPNIIFLGRYIEALLMGIFRRLYNKNVSVGWVLGACLMMPKTIFNQVNGFDTDYFLYYEEVDLCCRIKQAGYKVVYCPIAHIRHIGSVSGKRDYEKFTQYFYTSKLQFVRKNYSGLQQTLLELAVLAQIRFHRIFWRVVKPIAGDKAIQKIRGYTNVVHNER